MIGTKTGIYSKQHKQQGYTHTLYDEGSGESIFMKSFSAVTVYDWDFFPTYMHVESYRSSSSAVQGLFSTKDTINFSLYSAIEFDYSFRNNNASKSSALAIMSSGCNNCSFQYTRTESAHLPATINSTTVGAVTRVTGQIDITTWSATDYLRFGIVYGSSSGQRHEAHVYKIKLIA